MGFNVSCGPKFDIHCSPSSLKKETAAAAAPYRFLWQPREAVKLRLVDSLRPAEAPSSGDEFSHFCTENILE